MNGKARRVHLIGWIGIVVVVLGLSREAAWAEEDKAPINPTVVNLQVQVQRPVPNDWIRVSLAAQSEDVEPERAASKVNQSMRKALDQLRARPGFEIGTGSYHVYPVYDKNQITQWRASQELFLEGKNMQAVIQSLGKLQSLLTMTGMVFSVSPATREHYENLLQGEAIAAFRARATLAMRQLGRNNMHIDTLDIQTGETGPRPVPMMRTMDSAMAASPVAEPGSSRLTVTVSGRVALR